MFSELVHATSPAVVTDVWDPDPDGMRLPGLQTTGATGGANFDT